MTRRHRGRTAEAGFTLIELLVSLVILVLVLVGILELFDTSSDVARAQTHIADMQQSLRIGQYDLIRTTRMAGRGALPSRLFATGAGFPGKSLPDGVAIEIRNDVEDEFLIAGDASTPPVADDSDVLTIRGVFDTPIYQINPLSGLTPPPQKAGTNLREGTGSVIVRDTSPTGVAQSLTPLTEAETGDALLLVSSVGDDIYSVVELTAPPTCAGAQCTVPFTVGTGGTHTDSYATLSARGGYPEEMTSVSFAGLVEEHRIYAREVHEDPDDPGSELITSRLARARFYPGTETPYPTGNTAAQSSADIADNILDLQAAFGIDTDNDGNVVDADSDSDEWLFNHPDDDPTTTATWNGTQSDPARLAYVRISTLARTDRPDPGSLDEPVVAIEDHEYGETATPASEDERIARMHRRQQLQTTVDLRNL